MSRKDLFFFALFLAVTAFLLGRALFLPSLSLGNFGDIYAYHYPLRHLVASTLQQGRLPLWNPYIFCGTPLAANPQAGLFDPLSGLFYFLPLAKAFDINTALRFLLGYGGAALLCRRWGLPSSATFALASAFVLSPFLVYRVAQGVPTLLASLAFVPWTWLAVDCGSGPLLGLALGLQLLSGHPQFLAINIVGIAFVLLLKRRRALWVLILGGAAGAAATAAQWLPTLQFLRLSVRSHWVSLYASAYSWEPRFLKILVDPGALGDPIRGTFSGVPSEYFEMAGLYLGLVPLLLAGYALARGRGAAAFGLLAAVGLFFAFGAHNPLLSAVLERPGLGSLRVPSRWLLLTLWGLWVCACAGWKALGSKFRASPPAVQAALALFVVLELAAWDGRFLYGQNPASFLNVNRAVLSVLNAAPQRFATSPEVQNPDKALLYRLRNVTGYEAFYLAGAALEASNDQGKPSADGSRTYIEDFKAPGFSKLALRYFVTPRGVSENPAVQPLAFHEGSLSPDPNAPMLSRVDAQAWDLEETVPVGSPALILSEAYYPGWKVWVNEQGALLRPFDGFLQRVPLSAPSGTRLSIHLRFQPGLEFFAMGLSVAALTLLAGAAFLKI